MAVDVIPIRANFYARPPDTQFAAPLTFGGVCVRPLVTLDGAPPTYVDFFSVSFEQACERLRTSPAIDIEPDGFFVWNGLANAPASIEIEETEKQRIENQAIDATGHATRCPWRLSGQLVDFDDRVHRLELHGTCPVDALHFLWSCLGWPATPVACELIEEGVALDETEFWKWAASRSAASDGMRECDPGL